MSAPPSTPARGSHTASSPAEEHDNCAAFLDRRHRMVRPTRISVERILTDKGNDCRNIAWRHRRVDLAIKQPQAEPYRPDRQRQKVERSTGLSPTSSPTPGAGSQNGRRFSRRAVR
jgi:hypothetical protein